MLETSLPPANCVTCGSYCPPLDLRFSTMRRHGEQSDAAVNRPYTQPGICEYVFYEPRTSFLSEKTSNRQIDTEVLTLYRLPFSGLLSVLKKKKKRIVSNTDASIIQETKGFPVSTQLVCLHFSLGDPQAWLPQSHILNSEFRQSSTMQKGCFPEKFFPLEAIMLQKHGEHPPSCRLGWVNTFHARTEGLTQS